MYNVARRRRSSRRKGCRRNRVQRGGTDGFAYRFGASVDPTNPSLGNAAEVIRFPSCEEATRPGYIQDAQIKGGLPGFAGGSRRRRRYHGGRGAFTTGASQAAIYGSQAGGRFTNEFNVVGDSKVAIMEPTYSGCGDIPAQNPLNKGDISSLITAPAGLVPTPSPGSGDALQRGGRGRRSRRNRRRRSQWGGVGGVDSMVYEAPRTGYTHEPSTSAGGQSGTLADGKTPFLVNVPYTTQPTPSSACLKTGGGSRKTRRGRKSRKNRKSRRNGRK